MRPLGYVLLVFNLLAGGAFVYLGIQDWRGRQEINAAGLNHILKIRGLPFDGASDVPSNPDSEITFKVEMAGGTRTDTVGPEFLKKYFQEAGAGETKSPFAAATPVASQLAELRRVRKLVKDAVDAAPSADQKARLLGGWLEYQVETYAERVVIQKYVEAKAADKLAVMLDLKFQQIDSKLLSSADAALVPEAWTALPQRIEQLEAEQKKTNAEADDLERQGADARKAQLAAEQAKAKEQAEEKRFEATKKFREAVQVRQRASEQAAELNLLRPAPATIEAEQRTRLAHLLVHLDTDAGWQKRVALVVGLRHYVKVIASQALRFRQMADHVERIIYQDQEAYISELALLRDQAIMRTQMVMDVESAHKKLTEQRDNDKKFVEQRQRQLADLEKQLATIKADVAKLLGEQTGIERELYTLQRDIAITLDEVYELQEKLADAERKRFTVP